MFEGLVNDFGFGVQVGSVDYIVIFFSNCLVSFQEVWQVGGQVEVYIFYNICFRLFLGGFQCQFNVVVGYFYESDFWDMVVEFLCDFQGLVGRVIVGNDDLLLFFDGEMGFQKGM